MRTPLRILLLTLIAGWIAVAPQASATTAFNGSDVVRTATAGLSSDSLHIDIVGGDSLTVDPGKTITVVYRITPQNGASGTFEPVFELPDDWAIVFGNQPLEITDSSPVTRFVTFKVPGSALAGTYRPSLAITRNQNEVSPRVSSLVQVESIWDLSFDVGPTPTYLAAGKAFSAIFELSNDGNTAIEVDLKAQERKNTRIEMPERRIRLEPGEFREFEARISTDADMDHSQRSSLRFEARLVSNEDIVRFVTVAFDIVPVYARIKPKAAKTPLSLALETVGDENGVTPQARINAHGKMLGGNVMVSAQLSEMPRQKFYGQERLFTARYESESLTVTAGDHREQFSPMTLTGERGVGVATEYRGSNWAIKGTMQRSRSVFPVQKRAGVSAKWITSKTSSVSANLLHRNEFYTGTVLTVRSLSQPFGPTSKLDLECGINNQRSLQDPSCMLLVSNASPRLSYRVQAQRASESFPGTVSGTRMVSTYTSYRISPSWRVDQTSSIMHRSLGDGFGRNNVLVKAGLTFTDRLAGGSLYATVHGIHSGSQYDMARSSSERRENMLRLTTGYQLARLGLTVAAEEGRASGLTSADKGSLRRWKTNARVSPLPRWNINTSYELSSGNLSAMAQEQRQRQFGLGTTFALPKDIRASITGFHSIVESQFKQQYSSLRAGVSKTFNSGRVLSARVQVNQNTGRQSLRTADYRIGFETPLAVPFSRRTGEEDILRGRVVDNETGQAIADALVFLGNELAITDSQGRFRFGRPGQDIVFLRLDAASLGYDRAPVLPMPMQIGPEHFTGQELVIPVARTATVSGEITIYGNSNVADHLLGNGNTDLQAKGGLYGAILQIENDTVRQRTRSNRNGAFTFSQLPPGTYSVSVVRSDLDDYQRLETTFLEVTLEEGEEANIRFRVIPARKSIRMIQQSNLSMDSGSLSLSPSGTSASRVSSTRALSTSTAADSGAESGSGRNAVNRASTEAGASASRTSKPSMAPSALGGQDSMESAPGTGWMDLLKSTARDQQLDSGLTREGGLIPLTFISPSTRPKGPNPLHTPLLVLCLVFMLLVVDLLLRHFLTRSRSRIRQLNPPAWHVTVRFAWYYAALIVGAVLWAGSLMGLATALALSGISVAIESRHTYMAIVNIVRLEWVAGIKPGSWIRYRQSAIRLHRITLAAVEGNYPDGKPVSIPTYCVHELCVLNLEEYPYREFRGVLTISRLSNLRTVRQEIHQTVEAATSFGAVSHAHIRFEDLDSAWTAVHVHIVTTDTSFDPSFVANVLRPSMLAGGVVMRSNGHELDTAARGSLQGHHSPADGPDSELNDRRPTLRLIKGGQDTKAA